MSFTQENTRGYTDQEIADLNAEWAGIVEAGGLELETDEYYQREGQFADEVSRRHPPIRTNGTITWSEDQSSGRGYLRLICEDGGNKEVQWDVPITASTDSHEIAGLFDGIEFVAVEHDGECIHVTIAH